MTGNSGEIWDFSIVKKEDSTVYVQLWQDRKLLIHTLNGRTGCEMTYQQPASAEASLCQWFESETVLVLVFLKPSAVLDYLLVIFPVPPVVRTIHLHEIEPHPFLNSIQCKCGEKGCMVMSAFALFTFSGVLTLADHPSAQLSRQLQADPLICDQESAYQAALTCEDLKKHVAFSFTGWAQPFCAPVAAAANKHVRSKVGTVCHSGNGPNSS